MNKDDIKALRAGRRNALKAAGALADSRKVTRTKVIPSGKRYRRKDKHGRID